MSLLPSRQQGSSFRLTWTLMTGWCLLAPSQEAVAAQARPLTRGTHQGTVLLAQAGVQATAQEPAEVETLFRQAEAFEEKGDYRQASELWERIVTIHEKVLGP